MIKKNIINRIKLAKALMKFGEVETTEGIIFSFEGELAEGVEIFFEKDGDIVPVEDGTYALKDGKSIVVEGGIVKAIEDVKPEEKPEEKEEEKAEKAPEEMSEDEIIDIDALREKIAEMEQIIAAKDAEIEELKKQIEEKENISEELKKQLKQSIETPVKDDFKDISQFKAINYFK